MRLAKIEIGNFRKLVAVRVDLAAEKTVFVGANNSGKTSAMAALHKFLVDPRGFTINDLSLTHWNEINARGENWEVAYLAQTDLPPAGLDVLVPQIDVWLEVGEGEMHHVQKLLPTLDWNSGPLGVRMRYEPNDMAALQQEYLAARSKRTETLRAAAEAAATAGAASPPNLELWPQTLMEFLDRRMKALFRVKAYILDPARLQEPEGGRARMQSLSSTSEPVDGNPLEGLVRINEISAQRGLGMPSPRSDGDERVLEARSGRRLSGQLRSYYDNHLDWQDTPELTDLKALEAIDQARRAFDERLAESFQKALTELTKLGYPGVSDPKLRIATKLRLQDGLSHDSAVQYEIAGGGPTAVHRLPEDSNGLGYQNLVSMVFALMSYRDAWMQVGKAKPSGSVPGQPAPLHLVLIEEPEAYLHAQVQQVFIRHAYDVLRNLPQLGASPAFATQLVVSTHSSQIAHASDFASLRYFRRLPAETNAPIPISSVVNLSDVFGDAKDQTARFVARYLKATHCDLFFADGAVFIEGAAERILVPHFVEERKDFEYLRSAYISWLEIGGSHAHRFRKLVEALGLTTLIITDLDAKDPTTGKAVLPARGKGQEARNETVRTWAPKKVLVDELLDLKEEDKAVQHPGGYSVRTAYQGPVDVTVGKDTGELLANTFEDAVLYSNLAFFEGRAGTGLAKAFKEVVEQATSISDLASKAREAIGTGNKAEFALDLLFSEDVQTLAPPKYIRDGLLWLIAQLERKEAELAPKAVAL